MSTNQCFSCQSGNLNLNSKEIKHYIREEHKHKCYAHQSKGKINCNRQKEDRLQESSKKLPKWSKNDL